MINKSFLMGGLLLLSFHAFSVNDISKRYSPPYTEAPSNSYPWVVKVYGRLTCTGVQISNIHILTSAHCLIGEWNYQHLSIGSPNSDAAYPVKPKRFIVNSEYNSNSNDLAIIEMETLSDIATPIINTHSDNCSDFSNKIMLAAGYQGENALRLVQLNWLSCKPSKYYSLNYSGVGKPGDSGSPLFFQDNMHTEVIGIHSEGYDFDGSPILYTPLAKNKEFIETYIQFNSTFSSDDGSNILSNQAISLNISDWQTSAATSATSALLSFVALSIILTFLLQAV